MSKREAPIIRTARLKLRRRHEKDIPFMLDLFNNDEVRQYLGGYPPRDEAAMRYMIRRRLRPTGLSHCLIPTNTLVNACF